MSRGPMMQPSRSVLALVMLAALLSGCGGSDDRDDSRSSGGRATSKAVTGEARPVQPLKGSAKAFPTCDEVKAELGPAVADLVELPDTDNGVTMGAADPSLLCAWHTKETETGTTDFNKVGGLSVGISRDPEYTEESMQPLGWVVKDPQVSAAGAWALKAGGTYDPSDPLDETGVQVVRDGVVVTLTTVGAMLQDVPQLASLTNRWAMGAGVVVLDLADRR